MIKDKDFANEQQYTAAIEAVCHECDGPGERERVEIKKTYKMLAYLIKAGDEIDLEYGSLPLGTALDTEGKLYAFILTPVYKMTPVVPEEKKEEGEEDVNTGTTRPD